MKNLLYIATSNMFVRTGGGLANLAFYNALESYFHGKVDVIHMSVKEGITVPLNFHLVPGFSKAGKIKALLSGKIHRYNPWILDFIDSHPGVYSHCIINCGDLGDLVEDIQKRDIKVAVIHHNYEVEFQMDNKSPSTFLGYFPWLLKRNERKAYKYSDLNLFLTQSDKNTFNDVYGRTKAKENVVIGVFEEDDKELVVGIQPLNSNRLAICGSLNSVQTVCGIKDFASHYLKEVHDYYHEDFKLVLTGRSPGKYIQNLAAKDSSIRLVPSPANISEVIRDCGIFICPINVGGGIKLRIMDGLKLGMPILTHKVSARGYDWFYGKEWFQVYHDTKTFLKGLSSLTAVINKNPNLREEIINEYQNIFSFRSGKKRMMLAIGDFLNS